MRITASSRQMAGRQGEQNPGFNPDLETIAER